jgi:hypothetical protein
MAFPTAVKMASALEALGQEAAKTVRAKVVRPIRNVLPIQPEMEAMPREQ